MKSKYDVLSKLRALRALEGIFASKLARKPGSVCNKKSGAIVHTKIITNQLSMLNRMVKTSDERSAREFKKRLGLRPSLRTVQKYINMRNCGGGEITRYIVN